MLVPWCRPIGWQGALSGKLNGTKVQRNSSETKPLCYIYQLLKNSTHLIVDIHTPHLFLKKNITRRSDWLLHVYANTGLCINNQTYDTTDRAQSNANRWNHWRAWCTLVLIYSRNVYPPLCQGYPALVFPTCSECIVVYCSAGAPSLINVCMLTMT